MLSDCENVETGEVRIGGQEHFYFEPQSCIVIPTGQIVVIESLVGLGTLSIILYNFSILKYLQDYLLSR